MFRKAEMERAILVLPLRDDGPLDQITPIAELGPAMVYTCIRVIEKELQTQSAHLRPILD